MQNALKHVGANDVMVAKKIKKTHIRRLVFQWLW